MCIDRTVPHAVDIRARTFRRTKIRKGTGHGREWHIGPIIHTCHENRWEAKKLGCGHLNNTNPEMLVNGNNAVHVGKGDNHGSSALALLIVQIMRKLPSKSTTMWRDDFEADFKQPRPNASRIEPCSLFPEPLSRTRSLRHTRSPRPTSGVTKLRTLQSSEWCHSLCSDHASANHLSGMMYHATRRGPASRPTSKFSSTTAFVVVTRPPTVIMALSAIPLPAESPGGVILSTVVAPSTRSTRTRRMSLQMLGSPSVPTVTSWHSTPSIHFTSKRPACGSPPPFIDTAAAIVMPERLSYETNNGVESPLREP